MWTKTIPAKLQSYMACGMPIIASAQGETERIIREAECGVCSSIGNPEALADAIRDMMTENLDEMHRKSREYFKKHFEKQMLMDEMERYFNK